MCLIDILREANEKIVFIGILPIAEEIEKSAQDFADILEASPELKIHVLCESDDFCFQLSMLVDNRDSTNRKSYTNLKTHRDIILGTKQKRDFFHNEVAKLTKDNDAIKRVFIKQQNTMMSNFAIIVDDVIYYTLISNNFPALNNYVKSDKGSTLYQQILNYTNFMINGEGKQFLSSPEDELLQLLDKNNIPRGIFPRSCFYTTKFKRRSIWGFVFNRKGELLLHQRSFDAKDGQGLWDKSVGGHIDFGEDATVTAKRELIEELFMKEAEFTSYIDAKLSDVLGFGEWNRNKRHESSYKGTFDLLDDDDWILFTATDKDNEGKPLIIDRVSQRRYHWSKEKVEFRPTIFVSNVFFFIAPKDCIDTEEQVKIRFEEAEKKGAAQDHKTISIDKLRDWIEDEIQNGKEKETFTDDLVYLYVNNEYIMSMLEQLSYFIKYIFNEN